MDSVNIGKKHFIYWYRIDRGIYGYSDCKLAMAYKSEHVENKSLPFFISNYITDIKVVTPDKIEISLYYDEYHILQENQPNNFVIDLDFKGDQKKSYQFRIKK